MPCAVSQGEKDYYEARSLLEYVCEKTGQKMPELFDANGFSPEGEPTQQLCAMLRRMDPAVRENLVYVAHDRMARRLADWWEEHQEKDSR